MTSAIKLGFLASGDPLDRQVWSGLPYSMWQHLRVEFPEAISYSPLSRQTVRIAKGIDRASQMLTSFVCPPHYNHRIIPVASRRLKHQIRQQRPDVVFAAAASSFVPAIPDDIPVIYFTDGTFRQLNGYYERLSKLSPATIQRAEELEAFSINRAAASAFSSQWAADSAIADYGADPARVHVVPFGSAVDPPPRALALDRALSHGRVNLLLVGVDWKRKGIDIAIQATTSLRNRGIDARLTVVGAGTPGSDHGDGIEIVGFLDKSTPSERAHIERLYQEADFFLLPTRAECSAIVFCEAAAYGLPSLATQTGGIPEIILDGETGMLLPLDADGNDFADLIQAQLQQPAHYRAMSLAARDRYERVLNWSVWSSRIAEIVCSIHRR